MNVTNDVFTSCLLFLRETVSIEYMDYIRISGLHG